MTPKTCPKCGLKRLEIKDPRGVHIGRYECPEHGFLGWMPKPWTFERAKSFRMPFGRFKGKTIEEIYKLYDGPGYLAWCRDELPEGGPQQAAIHYLRGVAKN